MANQNRVIMQNPKFQIFKGGDTQSYFRLRAKNGEPILISEGYMSRSGCMNGIKSVKENSIPDERYERKTAGNNFSFVLKASNGEPIGRSEMYTTEQARENGITAIKIYAVDAPVEDTTL